MRVKKIYIVFIVLALIVLSIWIILQQGSKVPTACVFCDQKILNYQKFYEDEQVIALYTHKPVFPCHCLILPKRHIERFEDLSDEELLQISHVIKKVNLAAQKAFGTSAYFIHQKNGIEAGQSVPHVHFHYIARKLQDKSDLKFLLKLIMAYFKAPIVESQMQDNIQKLQIAMQEPSNK